MKVQNNKQLYANLCASESSIPIFSQAWWLDALCGNDGWDAILVTEKDTVVATMPFSIKNRWPFKIISQPKLTQKLGPWYKLNNLSPGAKLEREKKIFKALFESLPSHDHFAQSWDYSYTNWLPLYWLGYHQTTRYTYTLDLTVGSEKLWDNLFGNIRREIKKAKNRFKLNIVDDLGIDAFLDTNEKSFLRQNKVLPYTRKLVDRLDKACAQKDSRKILFAVDENNNIHAAIYIVWDNHSAYYLMGGADPNLRTSGAMSLLLWNAILFAQSRCSTFDFEGSMIEPIERFFRSFGAIQTPYFNVTHTPSVAMRLYYAMRGILVNNK